MNGNQTLNYRTLLLMSVFILSFHAVWAQNDYGSFCHESFKTNNAGMMVLGSWAVANMAGGAYGWSRNDGRQKYFHQMNFFWNTVNLSIAGIALYSNSHVDCSLMDPDGIMGKHLQTERILLINSVLDAGYIGTGLLLSHLSGKSANRGDLLKGYGQSLVLQGGFLLAFDLVLYGIMRNQRLDFMNDLNLTLSPWSTGLQITIPL